MKIQIGQTEYKLPFRWSRNLSAMMGDGQKVLFALNPTAWNDEVGQHIAAALNAQAEKDAEIKRLIDERYELAKDLRHQMEKRLAAENDAFTKGQTLKSYDKYEIPALKQKITSLESENKRMKSVLLKLQSFLKNETDFWENEEAANLYREIEEAA